MRENVSAELLQIRWRVLAHLEQQRAELGVYTPPYIQLEIERTRQEIELLMHYSYVFTLEREVLENERPQPMHGAIVLVSPEHIEVGQRALQQAAFDAIAYHRTALRHCWLIATTGEHGSLGAAAWLAEYCRPYGITTSIWPVDDPSSVEETFETVRLLYAAMESDAGVPAHDVVADITGATKPMSVGLLRACQGRSPIEYMVRQQQGPSLPMLLALPTPGGSPIGAGAGI